MYTAPWREASHPKERGQYDTALTALEKCQKTQESPLYNS